MLSTFVATEMKIILVVLCVAVFAEASQYHQEETDEAVTIDLGPLNTQAVYHVLGGPAGGQDTPDDLVPLDFVASHNARRFFNILRPMFPVGLVTIPPLDPYKSSGVTHAVHKHGLIQGNTNLTNIVVKGAKYFKLNKVSLKVQSHELEVHTQHHSLRANADFETLLNGKLNLHIQGHASVLIEDLNVETKLHTMSFPASKHFLVNYLKKTSKAKNVQVTLSDVFVEGKRINLEKSKELLKRGLLAVIGDIAVAQNHGCAEIINHAFTGVTREQVSAFLLDDGIHVSK